MGKLTKACPNCKFEFTTYRDDKIFCCQKCRWEFDIKAREEGRKILMEVK